ncbi:hypothetical protein B0H13DRAFT_2657703 [Mycena leptocephala]|nr:hypothetical protein B0H13DRAFT_2657703 [Mycena leptocephala]
MNLLTALLASFLAVAAANPVGDIAAREVALEARAYCPSSSARAVSIKKLHASFRSNAPAMACTQLFPMLPARRSVYARFPALDRWASGCGGCGRRIIMFVYHTIGSILILSNWTRTLGRATCAMCCLTWLPTKDNSGNLFEILRHRGCTGLENYIYHPLQSYFRIQTRHVQQFLPDFVARA